MKKTLFYFIILNLTVSCGILGNGVVVNTEKDTNKTILSPILNKIKEFSLDKETVPISIKYLQYIDADTMKYFSFLNEHNHTIYFYNYNSSSIEDKLEYYKHTQRPLNDIIRGYYYLNKDSIFLYSQSVGNGMLYGMDRDNNIFVKYPLKRESYVDSQIIYPSPWCRTWTPLKKWENKIIAIGFFAEETTVETPSNRPVMIISDINNRNIEYSVNYPEQYSKYNWGGDFTYRLPFYDIKDENIMVSFSAHHYLISHSLITGEEKEYYAGCSAISEIKSFPKSKKRILDETDVVDWYYKTPSYEGIYYDKYKKYYYRVAKLPVSESEYIKDEYNFKPTVIIVLDEQLNYIGEAFLPADIRFRTMNCFVSHEGFNIEVLTDDEDKITFYQYSFKQ